MPNQSARDKKWVSALLKRETVRKLEKLAAFRGKKRSELIASLLEEGVSDIELTPEDYTKISEEMRLP